MSTGKTTALTIWTFVGKVMSLLFNMLSRLVIAFLPRSKHFLISWLQSPSALNVLKTQPLSSIKLVFIVFCLSKRQRHHNGILRTSLDCISPRNTLSCSVITCWVLRESIPRQVDKKSGVPKEEKGVWDSQGGGRGLEFSRRKVQTFFLCSLVRIIQQ